MPFSSLNVRGDMWPPMWDSCLARRLLEFVQDGLSKYSMKWWNILGVWIWSFRQFFCALAQTPGGMLPSDELVGALLVAIDRFSSASWVSLIREEIGRGAQVHYFFRISLERSELNDNGQVFHARAKIHSVGLVAP